MTRRQYMFVAAIVTIGIFSFVAFSIIHHLKTTQGGSTVKEEKMLSFSEIVDKRKNQIQELAGERISLCDMSKIVMRISSSSQALAPQHEVLVDVSTGNVYVNAISSISVDRGKIEPTKVLTRTEMETLLSLFDKYHVLDWNRDYLRGADESSGDTYDGVWEWEIRFADKYGNIDYRGGGGDYRRDGMTPEGFDAFMTEVFRYFDVTPYLGHNA